MRRDLYPRRWGLGPVVSEKRKTKTTTKKICKTRQKTKPQKQERNLFFFSKVHGVPDPRWWGLGPVASEKKKVKADGKLDKFGRPNEVATRGCRSAMTVNYGGDKP